MEKVDFESSTGKEIPYVRIYYTFGGKFAKFNQFYNGYERTEQL